MDESELDNELVEPPALHTIEELAMVNLLGPFATIIIAFRKAAGERIADNAIPVSLKQGKLKLRCSSASWAQSISMNHAELIARLNKLLPNHEITQIDARPGGFVRHKAAPKNVAAPLAPLEAVDLERVDKATKLISDKALREKVRRAMIASERRRLSDK